MTTSDSSSERIYKAAECLFARRGYDGTSMRDICKEVGLNIATVQYHVHSKEELYFEVMRRINVVEQELFSSFLQDVQDGEMQTLPGLQNALKRITHEYIQYACANPVAFRLWAYRFLEADRFTELEEKFSLPFYQILLSLMQRARQAGAIHQDDKYLKFFILGGSWIINGYFNGRKNDWGDPNL